MGVRADSAAGVLGAMPLADAAISRSSERAADRYAAHVRFALALALGTVNPRRGLIRLVGRHPQTARRLHDSNVQVRLDAINQKAIGLQLSPGAWCMDRPR